MPFMELKAKIFRLGTLKFVHDLLKGMRGSDGIGPKWFRLDERLVDETYIYLLPVLICSQGNYCLLLKSANKQEEHISAYRRAGFARVDYKGCLGKTGWFVPGWSHTQPWPVQELERIHML
jgi:hypothetical protein